MFRHFGQRTALAFGLALSSPVTQALESQAACRLKSPELKLARECFSGDMHLTQDTSLYLENESTGQEGHGYCYRAFVMVHHKAKAEIKITVLHENSKGEARAFHYALLEQDLNPPTVQVTNRGPASTPSPKLTFQNLKAECFETVPNGSACRQGLFGFGSSRAQLGVELQKSKSDFQPIKATHETTPSGGEKTNLHPQSESDMGPIDPWLLQLVKLRLLNAAQTRLTQARHSQKLGMQNYRHCRMALDGLVRQKKLAEPFNDKERKTLDNLDEVAKNLKTEF